MGNPKSTAVPDVFGDDQRAESIAVAVMAGQKALVDLEVQQRLNGHGDDVVVPGAEPGAGGEAPETYKERRQRLLEGCRLLVEDNADLREAIEAVAAKWRAERAGASVVSQLPEQGE